MPIYEYRCTGCGRVIEVFSQSASANVPPPECLCGVKNSFEKIYSAFAAQTASGGSESAECCGGGGHAHSCGSGCMCGHGHG